MFENLRLLAHAFVLAGLWGVPLTGSAQTLAAHKVGLDWVRLAGAESCIEAAELAGKVEQRLEREVFSRTSDSLLVIDGTVAPAKAQGFNAIIRVRGPDGTLYGSREVAVPDPDCRKLDEVVALIISVTLRHGAGGIALPESIADQLAGLFDDPPAENPAVNPQPAPAADSGSETAPSVEAPAWQLQIEAGFGMVTGLATSASFAPLLRVQLELWELFSVGLEGRLGLVQSRRIDSEPRGSLDYHRDAIALFGCVTPLRAARLALSVCVDGRVGNLDARARDFAYNYDVSARWLEVALAGSLRAALLGPTFAHLRVGLPWRVIRPQFKFLSSQGDLHDALTVAPWGLDLSLSLGVEF